MVGKADWPSAGMPDAMAFGIFKRLSGTKQGRRDSWGPGHRGGGGWLPGGEG